MVPSSFRVTVTPTSAPPKPGAAAVRAAGSSAGVSSANRLFTALITPSEVKVAPVTMSTSVNGPALPMNWFTKLSARTRSHTGGSCLLTSMASVAMVPSSFRVTVTPTSAPPKPGAAAVRAAGSSAGVSSANRLFTALITPSEVKVAPVTMSTSVNGPALPMNWFTKLSARTRSHTGGSCLLTSMASVAMVPSSFRVTVTPTSAPPKPGAAAVSSLPAGAAGPSSPVTDMSLVGIRLFTALITPSEVKVAPVTMSTFSPFTKGPVLPMNWFTKLSASTRSHTGGT